LRAGGFKKPPPPPPPRNPTGASDFMHLIFNDDEINGTRTQTRVDSTE
jgi:hypothetical protein